MVPVGADRDVSAHFRLGLARLVAGAETRRKPSKVTQRSHQNALLQSLAFRCPKHSLIAGPDSDRAADDVEFAADMRSPTLQG